MKKIGINGFGRFGRFGRIGRLVLRRVLDTKSEVEIVTINDLTSPKVLAYSQRACATLTGSVTELVSILEKKVTVEEINAALKKATEGNESFGYTDEEIVSSDIVGTNFGSVFDATQTEVTEVGDLQLVKTVAWYDNEYGFVAQLVRVLDAVAKE